MIKEGRMLGKLFQIPICRLMIVLPLFVFGNILLGAVIAEFDQVFDKVKCKRGIFKGIIIYASMIIIVVASLPLKEELTVVIGGNEYTIMNAMQFILWTTIAIYAQDFFSKLITVFQINVSIDNE